MFLTANQHVSRANPRVLLVAVSSLVVAFSRRSSNQRTLNATVIPLGKTSIDFSTLDEMLGEGVAEGIWMMIRDAVAQEMHEIPY
ncbi:hypothetical protein PIB30_042002 [Stylosanthes scabra]|uniref:Uncharacterized protein n=1 Tax=Stylosanthes scabra TaxID=79078 RepID=A0ABU6QEJ5_9FABA|nr:hypothetical protein [Stylosanthes scabra]